MYAPANQYQVYDTVADQHRTTSSSFADTERLFPGEEVTIVTMPSLKSATQRCMKLFASVCVKSHTAPAEYSEQMTPSMLEDEYDRFKMWSGNLGALQKGHASLDWRLCDAEVMSTSIREILTILEKDLSGSLEVLTSERLPYEEQASDFDSDSDDTASDISQVQLPELVLRSQNINDTIKTLYKLSYSIRRPGVKVAPEKALLYREMIPDTTCDFGEAFNPLDRLHVVTLLNDLRKEVLTKSLGREVAHGDPELLEASESPLIDRLAEAVTKRRRKFKYWSRHKQKLAKIVSDEYNGSKDAPVLQGQDDQRGEERTIKEQHETPHAQSQSQGPLTETVASKYIPAPTDQDDIVSIAPSASTARDLEGHEAMLPKPPETNGEDFECPYCFVLCPAREATRNRWRKHMLEDLQPYLCTYVDCKLSGQLFGSRTAWVLHEDACHRQLWICRDHHDIAFASPEAYQSHLEREHKDMQPLHLQAVVESSATVREDDRDLCPLCLIPVSRLGKRQNLIKHIAHHLERISCFALPRYMELDREGDENDSLRLASDQSDDSRRCSDLGSLHSDQSDDLQDVTDLHAHPTESSDAPQGLDEDSLTTKLFRSCSEGDLPRVSQLLENGADPSSSLVDESPLHVASSKGHADIVRLLLECGADFSIRGLFTDTALQAASSNGHSDVVRLLLDYGAISTVRNGLEDITLQAASSNGHEDVVRLLLEAGAFVDQKAGLYGTALIAASANGYDGIVRLLLNAGANVNVHGGRYHSALQAASRYGHHKVVRLLLYSGASVDATGGEYGSALQAASIYGNVSVVQLLLNAGADVNIQGGTYGNALQAASACNQEHVMRLLLDSSADVNAQGGRFGSCLKAASMCGHELNVQLLLARGAEPLTYEEVDRMIEDAWRKYKQYESDWNDNRSAPICNLARSLRFQDYTEKAEEFLQRALDAENEKDEQLHLPLLDITELLALIYEDQARWQEAEAMYTRGVEYCSARLGASDPETLQRMRDLANCLSKQGKYQRAHKMHQQLLAIKTEILGQHHADTLQSVHDVAISLHRLERNADAATMLDQAIQDRRENIGQEEFGTLESTGELARVMECLGRFDKAISLYEQAGNGFEKTLGPEYHWTKTCRKALERLRR